MPQCCAFGCSTQATKGVKFHMLPANEERRKIWMQRISRSNWNPGKNTRLCEKHFTQDQYEENGADGLKKLKQNALPSIFMHRSTPKNRKPAMKRLIPSQGRMVQTKKRVKPSEESMIEENPEPEFMVNVPEQNASASETVEATDESSELQTRTRFKAEERIEELTRQLHSAKREIRNLKANIDTMKDGVKKTFNEDQLRFLAVGSMKGASWSNKTIQMALKLRLSCGLSGYNLLMSGFPFPSDRTLRRSIEGNKFQPGILS